MNRKMNTAVNRKVAEIMAKKRLNISSQASMFGCCNFFDGCTTELFSLYYGKDNLDLLDWMGFVPTEDCYKSVEFIEWVRAERSEGSATPGYISDPCEDPNGVEIGACKITVEDFGLYGRQGPARKILKPKYYCETSPRTYEFDGSRVTSEPMWDMFFTTDQVLNDLRIALVEDSVLSGDGHFDGLERWVRTGYDCQGLDATVVDWNSNPMSGGAGITINGAAVAAGFDFIDFLRDLIRRIRQRVSWSPLLANQRMAVGDMVIVAPTFINECLLDFFTCWSVCPEAITVGTNDANTVNRPVKEMRDFRNTLLGGLFGDGRIFIDGFEIPLLNYDWGTITGPTRGDLYVLTGSIGAQRVWEGQVLESSAAMDYIQAMDLGPNAGDYGTMGNYFLTKGDFDNLCAVKKMWMSPRLFCYAPWAQIRFQDVVCNTPSGPLSPNPEDTSFFITSSFSAAECP